MPQQLKYRREAVLHTIFLDLQKAYDALDLDRGLVIHSGYVMDPRILWLLRTYWNRMQIMGKAGSYFGPTFKGYWG